MSKKKMCVEGVDFYFSTGEAKIIKVKAELYYDTSVWKMAWIELNWGLNGFSDFCLTLLGDEWVQKMVDEGCWSYTGEHCSNHKLYISGLQMEKMLKGMDIYNV